MQTDLPEPVAPAISIWGILAISATTTLPPISFPTAKARLDGNSLNSLLSIKSRRATIMFSLFGTSIPTAAFPGMGASIRISVAARFSLISSERLTILLTFTPCSGCISKRVTDGPWLMSVTVTRTPKFCSVCCSFCAVSLNSLAESPPFFPGPFASLPMGGNMYFLGTTGLFKGWEGFCVFAPPTVPALPASAAFTGFSGFSVEGRPSPVAAAPPSNVLFGVTSAMSWASSSSKTGSGVKAESSIAENTLVISESSSSPSVPDVSSSSR